MGRTHRRMPAFKGSLKLSLATFALACIVVGTFSFQYYQQLQSTIRAESGGYLQEIATRIGANIDRTIADNYSFLHTVSSGLHTAQVTTFSRYAAVVEAQREGWEFQDIMLIDADGKAYASTGEPVKLDNDAYFMDAVSEGRAVISNAQMIDNEERIALSIPLENITMDGTPMVAMAAVYEPASFDETLSMSSFDGQSFSCIIDRGGTIVVRSSSPSALELGYNVLTAIGQSELDQDDSLESMKSSMAAEGKGQIGFTIDDVRYYAVYTPIAPQNWYLLTFVPASVVNARSDMMLGATLLMCGVVTAAFAALVAFLLFTSSRNRRKLEHIAYVDDVTGGHTIQRFYDLAQQSLSATDRPRYALVYTNMEKFKVLNEQFGRRSCDDLLRMFSETIESGLRPGECIGRQSADNFCILIEFDGEPWLRERFAEWYRIAERFLEENQPQWNLPIVEFGIFVIDNDELPFPQMIDRAKLALRESPQAIGGKIRYAVYDDEVRRLLVREKQLEDMMERAMLEGEFQVYLQPKYRLPERVVGGSEALTRWVSASEGMIFPDEFIPLFEKNGFIVTLDLHVFEEVCRTLRGWIDRGLTPPKTSVNCSRAHVKSKNFLDAYRAIADRYRIPERLIEIELTEGIVMEDSHRLIEVIEDIHEAGFDCSIDDFGSGYSSLNMIQSIPADTLKLDKIFFRNRTKDPARTRSVVQSIVSMAQALNMDTVAEGVEHEDQVDMLEEIGCDYVQGYVFARPMPIADFERLAFGEETNEEGGQR